MAIMDQRYNGRMALFELPPNPQRWLFAFTHPDDEISIGAWMRRLVQAGADVWAGWSVTDPVRAAEGTSVIEKLGAPKERLFYHGMPDKGACEHLPELASLWSSAIERAKPERIALGAFECGHIDHDSTNFAVHRACDGRIPMLEIPLYHTYLTRTPVLNRFADPRGEEVLGLEPEEWRLKREVSRMYKSQNIGRLLVYATAWGWMKGRPPALCRTERMRLQTHFDYETPNLPEPLRSRVMATETWRRWAACVKGR
ncbi:MAG: PIG-L family deacetylase [Armatimonadetes bacterium]|nr:PIG-L family deacetylase [Armatimonadota bacterium]